MLKSFMFITYCQNDKIMIVGHGITKVIECDPSNESLWETNIEIQSD